MKNILQKGLVNGVNTSVQRSCGLPGPQGGVEPVVVGGRSGGLRTQQAFKGRDFRG